MVIQTIRGNKIETTELENKSSDTIEIKDNLNMNGHNILSVSNINLLTINNLPYSSSSGGSNGKYSQVNGDVVVDGNNTDSLTAKSIISGTGFGSLVFSPNELSQGNSYHIKIAGSIKTHHKKRLNISCFLGNMSIYSTMIDTEDINIENLDNNDYAYESEIDFTIHNSGTNGKIYSNGQLLYTKGSSQNNLRGNSSEKIVDPIDLSNNLTLDIRIYWENSADSSESLTNKMVRVTKMF